MEPLVSVVVPVYNLENYILKNLESLVNQSYKNVEIVVVNDGSKDNSLQVIKEYLKDKEIKNQVIDVENGGVSRARNIGMDAAKGDYIILLDGDDRLKPQAIEKFINNIKETGADICFGGYEEYLDFNSKPTYKYCNDKSYFDSPLEGYKALSKKLAKEIWICTGNGIYSKRMLDSSNIRYSTGMVYGEDIEFISKCLFNANLVSSLKEDILEILVRPSSAMNSGFSITYMDALDTNRDFMNYAEDHRGTLSDEDFNKIKLLVDYDYINILLGVAKKIYEENGWLSVFKANKKVKELDLQAKLKKADVNNVIANIKNFKIFELKVFMLSKFLYFYCCKILFLIKKGN